MMRICLSLSLGLGLCLRLCEYAINFDNLPLLLKKIDHHHITNMLMMNMLRLLLATDVIVVYIKAYQIEMDNIYDCVVA